MPHPGALCYDVGMAENPYQAPQTRHEVPLLPAWRRHLSIPLIIVRVLAVAVCSFGWFDIFDFAAIESSCSQSARAC